MARDKGNRSFGNVPRVPLVYISGPITIGHPTMMHNLADAAAVCESLMSQKIAVLCPQLSILVAHAMPGIKYEDWMRTDLELVRRSDVVVRLPGNSAGADREVGLAMTLGIPVVTRADWQSCVRGVLELLKEQASKTYYINGVPYGPNGRRPDRPDDRVSDQPAGQHRPRKPKGKLQHG